MGNNVDYRSAMGQTAHTAYEIVETIDPIAGAAQHIISTYVEQIALVVITLYFDMEPGRSATHLLDQLRPLVRKTDRVFLLGHTLYFLLPGANQQGGQIVQNRLWEALLWRINNDIDVAVEAGSMRPRTITIGHSAYPIPCIDIDEFIKAASDVVLRFDRQREKAMRRGRALPIPQAELQSPKQDATTARRPGDGVLHTVSRTASLNSPTLGPTETSLPEQQFENSELAALARKLGIPYLALLPRKLPEDVQQLVNPKLAQELHCYPIGREHNMLTVAMVNPQDRSALDRLRQETGLHIFPVLTHPGVLQTALEQLIW